MARTKVAQARIEARNALAAEATKRDIQQAGIVELIRRGRSRQVAADAVGVHRTTIMRWAMTDEAFAAKLLQAEAEFKGVLLDSILKAALNTKNPGSWVASMTLLERRFPAEFGQRARLDVTIDQREAIRSIAEATGTSIDDVATEIEDFLREQIKPS